MKYQSTPVRFNKLKDGATGTGVESITAQYYVSTSKTTQTGGSWVETMPTWAVDTYLWIRNKIVYKDPASTEYTEPYCDSSWEAVNEIEIGSRNYIRKTDIKTYYEEWIPYVNASTLTLTENEFLKITPNASVDYCGAYGPKISNLEADTEYTLSFEAYANSNVTLNYCYIMCNDGNKSFATHIDITTIPSKYTLTFTTDKAYNNCSIMIAYRNANGYVTVPLYIRRVCVNKGNKANDWTAAPEDVQENISNVQDNVNTIETRVSTTELAIDDLKNQIQTLIVDENGESMMTQTSTGWSFDMTMFQDSLNTSIDILNDLSGKVDGVEDLSTQLNTILSDVVNRTAYVDMKNEEINGVVYPYIELGKRNDPDGFKVKITTTALYFMEGSKPVAWVSNKTLYIEKAIIKQELHIGEGTGFIFAKRANGNMGIRWKESD